MSSHAGPPTATASLPATDASSIQSLLSPSAGAETSLAAALSSEEAAFFDALCAFVAVKAATDARGRIGAALTDANLHLVLKRLRALGPYGLRLPASMVGGRSSGTTAWAAPSASSPALETKSLATKSLAGLTTLEHFFRGDCPSATASGKCTSTRAGVGSRAGSQMKKPIFHCRLGNALGSPAEFWASGRRCCDAFSALVLREAEKMHCAGKGNVGRSRLSPACAERRRALSSALVMDVASVCYSAEAALAERELSKVQRSLCRYVAVKEEDVEVPCKRNRPNSVAFGASGENSGITLGECGDVGEHFSGLAATATTPNCHNPGPPAKKLKHSPDSESTEAAEIDALLKDTLRLFPRALHAIHPSSARMDSAKRSSVLRSAALLHKLILRGGFDRNVFSAIQRGVKTENAGGLGLTELIALEHSFHGQCHLRVKEVLKTSVCGFQQTIKQLQAKAASCAELHLTAEDCMSFAQACVDKVTTFHLEQSPGTDASKTYKVPRFVSQAKTASRRERLPIIMLQSVISMQKAVLDSLCDREGDIDAPCVQGRRPNVNTEPTEMKEVATADGGAPEPELMEDSLLCDAASKGEDAELPREESRPDSVASGKNPEVKLGECGAVRDLSVTTPTDESACIESAAREVSASQVEIDALMAAADAKDAEISDLHAEHLIDRSDLCRARSEVERLNRDVEEANAQVKSLYRSVGEADFVKDDRDEAMELCRKKDEEISRLEGELRSAESSRDTRNDADVAPSQDNSTLPDLALDFAAMKTAGVNPAVVDPLGHDDLSALLSAYLVGFNPSIATYYEEVRLVVMEALFENGVFSGHFVTGDRPAVDRSAFVRVILAQLEKHGLVKLSTCSLLDKFVASLRAGTEIGCSLTD